MKELRITLNVAISACLAAVGLVLIAESWGVGRQWLEIWRATLSWQRIALGSLFILMVLIRAVLAVWPREGGAYLVLEQPLGQVAISLDGISDFLSKSTASYPWLESVRPDVSIRENVLQVDLRCRIRADADIPSLCARLQEHVRAHLKTYLGDIEVGRIRVTVRQLSQSSTPSRGSPVSPRSTMDLDVETAAKPWSS